MSAAAIIIRRQNRIMRAFESAGATSPESATTLEALGVRDSFPFRRLAAHSVCVSVGDGKYYLDREAAIEFRARRRTRILMFLLIMIAVLIVVGVFYTK